MLHTYLNAEKIFISKQMREINDQNNNVKYLINLAINQLLIKNYNLNNAYLI